MQQLTLAITYIAINRCDMLFTMLLNLEKTTTTLLIHVEKKLSLFLFIFLCLSLFHFLAPIFCLFLLSIAHSPFLFFCHPDSYLTREQCKFCVSQREKPNRMKTLATCYLIQPYYLTSIFIDRFCGFALIRIANNIIIT